MKLELCQGDNLLWLDQLVSQRGRMIDCVFADPPDNIGLGYEGYEDNLPETEYINLLGTWMFASMRVAKTVWVSFNSRWLLPMAHIASQLKDMGFEFKPCVQTFSFYQNNDHDFGNAHRPLWRFRRPDAPLYPEQTKIPSWRQQFGDKRAKAGGKVPGDAFDFTQVAARQKRDWHGRAVQCGDWVVDPLIPDDHFDFTRVTGNSKQRRSWHPTQLNEGLVERCLLMSTKPGDWVVDPFGGTGTTLRVAKKINRDCTLIELDPAYCSEIAKEHNLELRESGTLTRWESEYGPVS